MKYMSPPQIIIVFDTETSGLEPSDDILSIGWIVYDTHSNTILKHVEYYNNDLSISNNAIHINRVTIPMRRTGRDLHSILSEFHSDIQNQHIYAYNLPFDTAFISKHTPDIFSSSFPHEIQQFPFESVESAIQRITCTTFPNLNHTINLPGNYHSAYVDVYAEMIILLHSNNYPITQFFIPAHYMPKITFKNSAFYGENLDKICIMNNDFARWLYKISSQEPSLQYLMPIMQSFSS